MINEMAELDVRDVLEQHVARVVGRQNACEVVERVEAALLCELDDRPEGKR